MSRPTVSWTCARCGAEVAAYPGDRRGPKYCAWLCADLSRRVKKRRKGGEAMMSHSEESADRLLAETATLDHAIARDITYNADGQVEHRGELHYLTCVRCRLERRARELGQAKGADHA